MGPSKKRAHLAHTCTFDTVDVRFCSLPPLKHIIAFCRHSISLVQRKKPSPCSVILQVRCDKTRSISNTCPPPIDQRARDWRAWRGTKQLIRQPQNNAGTKVRHRARADRTHTFGHVPDEVLRRQTVFTCITSVQSLSLSAGHSIEGCVCVCRSVP